MDRELVGIFLVLCFVLLGTLIVGRSSKDAVIRVWNRKTLELHRTLRGHEGPVNAVGLQSGKVVRLQISQERRMLTGL